MKWWGGVHIVHQHPKLSRSSGLLLTSSKSFTSLLHTHTHTIHFSLFCLQLSPLLNIFYLDDSVLFCLSFFFFFFYPKSCLVQFERGSSLPQRGRIRSLTPLLHMVAVLSLPAPRLSAWVHKCFLFLFFCSLPCLLPPPCPLLLLCYSLLLAPLFHVRCCWS